MFYEPGKTDHGLPHDPFKVGTPIPPSKRLPNLANAFARASSYPQFFQWN